jgi:hypothetical protein
MALETSPCSVAFGALGHNLGLNATAVAAAPPLGPEWSHGT